ncbi:hypothetical protein C9374_005715 [Naegleria lovaniensis]|uniref:Uncharacterized protein n=1 Tax=Naegleria lovaniensis TaxID=51637 RepID=A0AA88GNZ5_NAELO|nr:uncharacterized protein C9374_005715 [Naegleria lovaniensis]KAG2381923.1 hypothetical protein C9374_005715 [Naegleria lovaniensis]
MLKLDHEDFCMSYEKLLVENAMIMNSGSFRHGLFNQRFTTTTSTQPYSPTTSNASSLCTMFNLNNVIYEDGDHCLITDAHQCTPQPKTNLPLPTWGNSSHDIEPNNDKCFRNMDPELKVDFQVQHGSFVPTRNHDLTIHQPSLMDSCFDHSSALNEGLCGSKSSYCGVHVVSHPEAPNPSETSHPSQFAEISPIPSSTFISSPTTTKKAIQRKDASTVAASSKGKGICKRSRSSSSLSASKLKQQSMQFTFPLWTFHVSCSSTSSSRH